MRNRKIAAPNSNVPVVSIENSPEHLNQILDLYLDPSKDRQVLPSIPIRGMLVYGTGYDGERQQIALRKNGEFSRRTHGQESMRLPIETGKIMYILLGLGYKLTAQQKSCAVRYQRYVFNGVSNVSIDEVFKPEDCVF